MTTPLHIGRPVRPPAAGACSTPIAAGPVSESAVRHRAVEAVDLDRLAHDIAHAGISVLRRDHLDHLAHAARAVGVEPVLIEILVDTGQPDIARARAYGRIITKILNAAWAATPPP
jgi:hypothetical protein